MAAARRVLSDGKLEDRRELWQEIWGKAHPCAVKKPAKRRSKAASPPSQHGVLLVHVDFNAQFRGEDIEAWELDEAVDEHIHGNYFGGLLFTARLLSNLAEIREALELRLGTNQPELVEELARGLCDGTAPTEAFNSDSTPATFLIPMKPEMGSADRNLWPDQGQFVVPHDQSHLFAGERAPRIGRPVLLHLVLREGRYYIQQTAQDAAWSPDSNFAAVVEGAPLYTPGETEEDMFSDLLSRVRPK